MAAPFLNPSLIWSALQDLAPSLVAQVVDLSGTLAGDGVRRLTELPGIAVMPLQRNADYLPAISTQIDLMEQVSIIIQLSDVPGVQATSATSLLTIQSAIWDALHGQVLAEGWSPLRYVSGSRWKEDDALLTWEEVYSTRRRCAAS